MRSVVNAEALRFLTPVREFTLHNATDEPVVLMYDGETRIIPPVDTVVLPHKVHEDVCCSALDEDGDYIPGTLVLRDVYDAKEMGSFMDGRMHWSAAAAIKHCLDIDVSTGIASGAYAKKGLSVLPQGPSKELVARIKSEGQDRYLEWRVQEARDIVEAYGSRTLAWQKIGVAAPPPGADYTRAVKILQLTGGKETSRLEKIFQGKLAPTKDPEVVEAEATTAADLSSQIIARVQEALREAKDGAVSSEDTGNLVKAVLDSPEAMKKIDNILRMKKAREAKKNASGV